MPTASITIHLPSHRRKSLLTESGTAEAVEAYGRYISEYLQFLKVEAQKKSLELKTDHQDIESSYSISAPDHNSKVAAHDWLHEQPDLWNWIP